MFRTFGTKYKIFLFNSIWRFILILQFLQFSDNLCSWSDWSDCSASCGSGFKIRQKTVSEDHGADIRNLGISECQRRKHTEKRTCFLPPCQGIFLNYLVKHIFWLSMIVDRCNSSIYQFLLRGYLRLWQNSWVPCFCVLLHFYDKVFEFLTVYKVPHPLSSLCAYVSTVLTFNVSMTSFVI